MLAVDLNKQHMQVKSIKESIQWNAWCADQLVSKTAVAVTNICREWASSKQQYLHQLIESHVISKSLINQALQTLFSTDEILQILDQITEATQPSFEEYDIVFPLAIQNLNLTLDSRRFEKYLFELSRTSIISELMEEVRQNCWAIILGDIQAWLLYQAIFGSGNRYCLQQEGLKDLLFKQIDGALLFVEQKISGQLLQAIIPEIYRQFDQREEHLRQSLYKLQHTDLLAEEKLHQVS